MKFYDTPIAREAYRLRVTQSDVMRAVEPPLDSPAMHRIFTGKYIPGDKMAQRLKTAIERLGGKISLRQLQRGP